MRSFIISSALLVILVQCGYPVAENSYPTTPSYPTPPPSYPTPKKYPVAPTYPSPPAYAQKPSYSAPPPPAPSVYSSSSFSDNEVASDSEYTTASPNSEYRKRAKARTAHNRKFQRRALTPIRRFQQKKQ
ncbi:Extensin-like [Caenorhabditis elegans]|uniref:Extensin-like n=1 Tax=Caenorhabditis elegans TaxID=6239 RepID=Q9N3U4_CAEEL|nr:Extensin-like [Caenorhabditis elegans]CCD69381.1 Extensin-like [Caenorhabditis elegans]|eukprot:NP_504224.2 Uncharacterized protein CELE_Y47D7A.11 [Caenorhabditis elegans]